MNHLATRANYKKAAPFGMEARQPSGRCGSIEGSRAMDVPRAAPAAMNDKEFGGTPPKKTPVDDDEATAFLLVEMEKLNATLIINATNARPATPSEVTPREEFVTPPRPKSTSDDEASQMSLLEEKERLNDAINAANRQNATPPAAVTHKEFVTPPRKNNSSRSDAEEEEEAIRLSLLEMEKLNTINATDTRAPTPLPAAKVMHKDFEAPQPIPSDEATIQLSLLEMEKLNTINSICQTVSTPTDKKSKQSFSARSAPIRRSVQKAATSSFSKQLSLREVRRLNPSNEARNEHMLPSNSDHKASPSEQREIVTPRPAPDRCAFQKGATSSTSKQLSLREMRKLNSTIEKQHGGDILSLSTGSSHSERRRSPQRGAVARQRSFQGKRAETSAPRRRRRGVGRSLSNDESLLAMQQPPPTRPDVEERDPSDLALLAKGATSRREAIQELKENSINLAAPPPPSDDENDNDRPNPPRRTLSSDDQEFQGFRGKKRLEEVTEMHALRLML